jgi:hypothetical protein
MVNSALLIRNFISFLYSICYYNFNKARRSLLERHVPVDQVEGSDHAQSLCSLHWIYVGTKQLQRGMIPENQHSLYQIPIEKEKISLLSKLNEIIAKL